MTSTTRGDKPTDENITIPRATLLPLVMLLAPLVAERMAAMSASDHPYCVTGPRPHGKSARWCRENLRKIPGHYRVGKTVFVSRADFASWVATQNAKRPTRSLRVVDDDDEALAERALEAAGLRTTRRAS